MHPSDYRALPPFQKGDIVGDGKYEIVSSTVNAGGFGRIYRAIDSHHNSDKKYAVKEFFVNTGRDDIDLSSMGVHTHWIMSCEFHELCKQFYREAKLLSLLGWNIKGPRHIPEVFSWPYEEDGRYFYVMDYIEGATITEEIRNWGPMLEKRAVGLIMQIGEELHRAHISGLVHSDISPNNIILQNGEFAVLVDFGNARSYDEERTWASMDDRTRRGFMPYQKALDRISEQAPDFSEESQEAIDSIGTPSFQAPDEFIRLPEGDVYSLACTLFFMLTGLRPKLRMDLLGTMSAFKVSEPTIKAIDEALQIHFRGDEAVKCFMQALMGSPAENS